MSAPARLAPSKRFRVVALCVVVGCSAAGQDQKPNHSSAAGSGAKAGESAGPDAGAGEVSTGGSSAAGTSGQQADAGERAETAGASGAGAPASDDPCAHAGVLACDDFEGDTLAAPFVITLDPYSQTKGSVALSSDQSHSGKQAVKVMGGSGYNERALVSMPSLFPVQDNHFFARFAVYFELDFPMNGHMSYALAADSMSPDGNEVRAGVHTKVLNWNFKGPDLGDPSLFSIDADGQYQTGILPSTHAWHCIELEFDGVGQTVRYYLDGEEVEKLHLAEDDRVKLGSLKPTWSPTYRDFRFGWQAYGTIPATIYYDDVVISTERVACAP